MIERREWKPEEESSIIAYIKKEGGWWLNHGDKVWQEMFSAGIYPRRTSSVVVEYFLDVMTSDLSRSGTSRQELRDCDPRQQKLLEYGSSSGFTGYRKEAEYFTAKDDEELLRPGPSCSDYVFLTQICPL